MKDRSSRLGELLRMVKGPTLVMTATICPAPGMRLNVRADPLLRYNDYFDALKYYLSLPEKCVDSIIFLENSDADLDSFRRYAGEYSNKRTEFINTDSNYDGGKGKGYGEFLMLDRGLGDSTLAHSESVFWKVTGRLRVVNLEAMVSRAPLEYDIYCDLRSVPIIGESLGGNKWVDLRLFSFTEVGYDTYLRDTFDLESPLEKSLFRKLQREVTDAKGNRMNSKIVPRFVTQPSFEGFSGFANRNYQSPSDRAKNGLRSVMRRLAPNLWL